MTAVATIEPTYQLSHYFSKRNCQNSKSTDGILDVDYMLLTAIDSCRHIVCRPGKAPCSYEPTDKRERVAVSSRRVFGVPEGRCSMVMVTTSLRKVPTLNKVFGVPYTLPGNPILNFCPPPTL